MTETMTETCVEPRIRTGMWHAYTCDTINGMEGIFAEASTAEECVDLFLEDEHADKDEAWWRENIGGDVSGIEEYNGKLYHHWVYYEHDRHSELFEDYTDDKPHSIKELKDYLIAGGELHCGWATRAPVECAIAHLERWETYWMWKSVETLVKSLDKTSPVFTQLSKYAAWFDDIRNQSGEEQDEFADYTCGRNELGYDGVDFIDSVTGAVANVDMTDFREVMTTRFTGLAVSKLGGYENTLLKFFGN